MYQIVVRFSHRQGFALKVPQPWPDRQDEARREQFRQQLRTLGDDPEVDVWFADESGFEGDPRPRRRWDRKGNKTRSTKNGDHLRMNVMGMVCPRTGEFFALEVSHSGSEIFQAFLREANTAITTQRRRNVLIVDNASASSQIHHLGCMGTDVLATLLAGPQSHRAHLAGHESPLVQQLCLPNRQPPHRPS